jgi:hypothetical protein
VFGNAEWGSKLSIYSTAVRLTGARVRGRSTVEIDEHLFGELNIDATLRQGQYVSRMRLTLVLCSSVSLKIVAGSDQ